MYPVLVVLAVLFNANATKTSQTQDVDNHGEKVKVG